MHSANWLWSSGSPSQQLVEPLKDWLWHVTPHTSPCGDSDMSCCSFRISCLLMECPNFVWVFVWLEPSCTGKYDSQQPTNGAHLPVWNGDVAHLTNQNDMKSAYIFVMHQDAPMGKKAGAWIFNDIQPPTSSNFNSCIGIDPCPNHPFASPLQGLITNHHVQWDFLLVTLGKTKDPYPTGTSVVSYQ